MPFDPATGKTTVSFGGDGDFGSFTCEYLQKKMAEDKRVCAITSATPTVFGFTEDIRKKAGKQFIDVGIAEEQAAAMASGIAKNGRKAGSGAYTVLSYSAPMTNCPRMSASIKAL